MKRLFAVALVLMLLLCGAATAASQSLAQVIRDYNSMTDDGFLIDCVYDPDHDAVFLSIESTYTAEAWKAAYDNDSSAITTWRNMLYFVAKCLKEDLRETERPYIQMVAGLISSDGVVMAASKGFAADWIGDFEGWNAKSPFYMIQD